MEIRALYKNTEVIPFEESPKVAGASNHSLRNFDASLRRRTWFMAFSNYYHAENKGAYIAEWSPFMEFGKNLLSDYDESEMNQFYNFMAYCLHTYMKFRKKISPPMKKIEQRNIQRDIGDEFIWWAEDWFTSDRLNAVVDKSEAFLAWTDTFPEHIKKNIKMKTFTSRLALYCQYMGWKYNPPEMLKTSSEQERGEIRLFRDGKNTYCFYISTDSEIEPSVPAPLEKSDIEGFTDRVEETPPF
jgi:hypothetical protein